MKRILITGANSYIGTSFEKWMAQYKGYEVDTIDMKDSSWREKDFSGYDVVFHVAGIAHVDVGKANRKTRTLYYKVNRDLAIETANKAKMMHVKQFIFMSSMIIYGESSQFNEKKVITKDTIPKPLNFYGDSKWQADQRIRKMENDTFHVAVLRPPMIYGRGCKGNYQSLSKIARILPVFPEIDNQRSMLHIDNLCEFIKLIIDYEDNGIFYPQNKEYVKTSEMVQTIAKLYGKKIVITKKLRPLIWILGILPIKKTQELVNKAFGNLVYEKSLSKYKKSYIVCDFLESIYLTEG